MSLLLEIFRNLHSRAISLINSPGNFVDKNRFLQIG